MFTSKPINEITGGFWVVIIFFLLLLGFSISLSLRKSRRSWHITILLAIPSFARASLFIATIQDVGDCYVIDFSNHVLSVAGDAISLLFFSSFILVIALWGHYFMGNYIPRLFYFVVSCLFVIQFFIWHIVYIDQKASLQHINSIYYCLISCSTAACLFVCALLYHKQAKKTKLKENARRDTDTDERTPINSPHPKPNVRPESERNDQRVAFSCTIACAFCLLGRSAFYIVLNQMNLETNILAVILYYFGCEIIPGALALLSVPVDDFLWSSEHAASQHSSNKGGWTSAEDNAIGVAFSGGGIRSASYCSGVLLELLKDEDKAERLKYVSCVSGGGYTGSAFVERCFQKFIDHAPMSGQVKKEAANELVEAMRKNAGYVVNWHSGFSGLFKGIADSVVFAFTLALWAVLLVVTLVPFSFPLAGAIDWCVGDFLRGPSKVQIILIAVLAGIFIFASIAKACARLCCPVREDGASMLVFISLLILVLVAEAAGMNSLNNTIFDDTFSISIFGFTIILRTLPPTMLSSLRSSQLGIFCLVLVYGRVLEWKVWKEERLFFDLLPSSAEGWKYAYPIAIFCLVFHPQFTFFKNHLFSYYYNWRLKRSFYTKLRGICSGCRGIVSGKNCTFKDLRADGFDLDYISNTTTNLWKETKSGLSESSDIVAISKKGWIRISEDGITRPQESVVLNMEISEAMTISGAALASNLGNFDADFKKYISAISFFGFGLGRWVETDRVSQHNYLIIRLINLALCLLLFMPIIAYGSTPIIFIVSMLVIIGLVGGACASHPLRASFWSVPLFRVLSHGLPITHVSKEPPPYMYLSDGGHYENLALLPLLYLQVREIYCADGGEDSKQSCADLFKAMDLARLKLGCSFFSADGDQIDLRKEFLHLFRLEKDEDAIKVMPRAFTFLVRYPGPGKTVKEGTITYIKPRAEYRDNNRDKVKHIHGCCCNCCNGNCFKPWSLSSSLLLGKFPHHTTGNQFFTPKLFGAYNEEGARGGTEARASASEAQEKQRARRR